MKAAIYARKSTDDNSKSKENKSVIHQQDEARKYAAAHGWPVDAEHIYTDDGIRGAEFVNPRAYNGRALDGPTASELLDRLIHVPEPTGNR